MSNWAEVWTLRILVAGGNLFSGCTAYGLRFMMARTSGEEFQVFAARWLVLLGAGRRSDLFVNGRPYARMQFLSVPDILEGKQFDMPNIAGRHELQASIKAV